VTVNESNELPWKSDVSPATFWMVLGTDCGRRSGIIRTLVEAQRVAREWSGQNQGKSYVVLESKESWVTHHPVVCYRHKPVDGAEMPF
jgi:hypothetical protein